jgi:type IV secretion system protein VirD4
MWRDRDRYPEHHLVPDTFWLVAAALLFAACGLVWLIGQVAAILFGAHEHLPVRLVDMLGVLLRLPGTWDDPAKAWPPSSQPLLPGPVGMYAAAVLPFWVPALLYGLLVRLVSPRARRQRKQRGARWASWWQLRRLLVLGPRPGRSSSAAATASATGCSAGCIWRWSSAIRSWPSGRRDPSRPTGW